MAKINANTNEKVISLKKWLGLNQCADGDTMLNVGEASVMKNFKVTRDGTLKRRPGMTKVMGMARAYSVTLSSVKIFQNKSSSSTVTLYENYSVDQITGVITLTNSAGTFTGAQAIELLANAEPGQYYYYRVAVGGLGNYYYYRLDEVKEVSTTSASVTRYNWYGYKLIVESTDDGTDSPTWVWSGYVGGHEQIVCACEGKVYVLWDYTNEEFYSSKLLIGNIYKSTSSGGQTIYTYPESVCFFPFENKLYILTDLDYYVWDGYHGSAGSHFTSVQGYEPLIATSLQPNNNGAAGSYELLEPVNRLTGVRKVWLSPDGNTHKTFTLPEKNNNEFYYINDLSTTPPTPLTYGTDYTVNESLDEITFAAGYTLSEGVNSYEVSYLATVPDSMRAQVIHNTQYELYSGKTDTVVFLYGDGTNKCIYSGMDYNGMPRADYFPDLNDIRIGDENTPITQMIRHNAALLAFKKDSAWAIQQDIITLADGSQTFGYYVSPVNKAVGNEALGQVQLVDNNPITLYNKNIYQWVNSSRYSSNLTRDERQARVISDRVHTICDELDFENVMMWDDNDHQELYISNKLNKSLVWNYGKDAWYEYDIGPYAFINFHGTLYFCAGAGFLYEFDEDAESDDGEPINAQWVSGAMDFGVDYSRKYSSMLWVGLKAEEGTSVDVTVRTDRKDTFKEKVVPSTKAKVDGEPFMVKTKIKAKKFIYYRLILESNEIAPPVTVTTADIRVRLTGYAK